ncbi:PEPxxWA-CTERM sorting domain-containing protein [Polymorphobacter arshaanensis]|uniref:PEPxxWA-CTERM sorting domain-containing protein n=1 Tax=Glacieibacterium arshaanense TaxID=2511025 RepID=UPI001FB19039|nr:PEPxxWA-CTERM sorting domain-containing protein [Polymorphobacter arshaanensis]
MLKIYLFSGVILALATIATPVSAIIVKVTYTGTVDWGYDQTGIFGTPGADLGFLPYQMVYGYDTTRGNIVATPTTNKLYGGDLTGVLSPALWTKVTIGGVTTSFSPRSYGLIWGYNDGLQSQQFHEAEHIYVNKEIEYRTFTQNSVYDFVGNIPSSIQDPFSYNVESNGYAYGIFHSYAYDFSTGSYVHETYASMAISNVTLAAVPEPANWAMMIAGFGLTGAAMRRRREAALS